MSQHLLVTGGRGRLASLIAGSFRSPALEVNLCSRAGGPGFIELSHLPDPAILGKTTTLVHLAWSTLPATAEQNPTSGDLHDLPLLARLLDSCASLPAAQRPHFIFFSSGGTVYGNAPGRPNVETDPCQPIGRYGQTKLAAERMIEAAAARHELPCAILRISNPYGYPVPWGRVQGIIPHAIRSALEAKPLTLWGDGHARKDFIHHTDFLAALKLIVNQRLTGLYNLSSGESHSVHEIIALVEKHTGKIVTTTAIEAPSWDVQDSRLANNRLAGAIGWRPRVSLDEGIRLSVAESL